MRPVHAIRWQLALVMLLALTGCQQIRRYVAKHDNPVMPLPPNRLSFNDEEPSRQLAELEARRDANQQQDPREQVMPTRVQQTSGVSENEVEDTAVFNAKVVARVNGSPIFASDVLSQFGDDLRQRREKLPPERFQQERDAIICAQLYRHIQQRLLADQMLSDLKPEQKKQLKEFLDKQFEKTEIPRLKTQLKVGTKVELETELAKRGTSLEVIRRNFACERMAMEFMHSKSEKPKPVERQDLVNYYNEHLSDYLTPERVKWQQIIVPFVKRSRPEALEKAQAARKALDAGMPFDQAARKYSESPDAKEGGKWDWVSKGSVANTELEKHLFKLPVGEVSQPIEIEKTFTILLVLARTPEKTTPFVEVQDQIQQKLREVQQPIPIKLLMDMMDAAIIESDYNYLRPPPRSKENEKP